MRKIGVCVAALAALALPATASAEKIKLEGGIRGAPSASVKVGVEKKHGEITKVSAMRFRRVPVTCSDGSAGSINGNLPAFRLRGKDFTLKTRIQGTGIDSGTVRVEGRFRRAGEVVKGTVRFSFTAESGSDCDTNEQRYKATK